MQTSHDSPVVSLDVEGSMKLFDVGVGERPAQELGALTRLLRMTRDLIRVNGFVHAPQTLLTDGMHVADVLPMMQSIFMS
jgi:hypothetical protein